MKYSEAAQDVQPKVTFESVLGRFKSNKTFNEELLDILKERASIEEYYSKTLLKLHRRMISIKREHLGEFSPVWEYILTEISEASNSKSQLSLQLLERLEKILKSVSEHAFYQKSKSYEITLAKLVKEYEEKKSKFSKYQKVFDESKAAENDLKSKKQRSKLEQVEMKYSSAQENFQQVKLKWDVESINFLSDFEEFDKYKCNNLKTFSTEYCILLRQSYLKYNENLNVLLASCEAFQAEAELDRFANQLQEKVFENVNPGAIPPSTIIQLKEAVPSGLKASNEAVNNVVAVNTEELGGENAKSSNPAGDPNIDEDGFSKAPEDRTKWNNNVSKMSNSYFSDSDEEEQDQSAQKFVIDIKKDVIQDSPDVLMKAVQNVAINVPSGRGRRAPRKGKSNMPATENLSPCTPTSNEEYSASPANLGFQLTPSTSYSQQSPMNASKNVSLDELSPDVDRSKIHPEKPIQISVMETMNYFKDEGGNIRLNIIGEVCLSVVRKDELNEAGLQIRFRVGKHIERFLANPKLLLSVVNDIDNDVREYEISREKLETENFVKTPIIKYAVNPESLGLGSVIEDPLPIILSSTWKCDPNVTLLLINYNVNEKFPFHNIDGSGVVKDLLFSELSMIVPIDGEVESFQTKPTGHWNSEYCRMLWNVEKIGKGDQVEAGGKLLAKFEVKTESVPAPVAVRFLVNGCLASNLSVTMPSEELKDKHQINCNIVSGRVFIYPK